MSKKWKYYYIERFDMVGRRNETNCNTYIFREGRWVDDVMHIIEDRLYAYIYDSDPWSFGDSDLGREIREISKDRAEEIMTDHVSLYLFHKCTYEFKRDEWEYTPGWWKRVATTKFVLYGNEGSINFIRDWLDVESFEELQESIEKELKKHGATDIVSCGYTEDRSEEDVEEICDQFVDQLIEKWTEDFREAKEEWDKNPGWQSKGVETEFWMNEKKYVIYPEMIGLKHNGWDDAFMEMIQEDIEEDLNHYGITHVNHYGFID